MRKALAGIVAVLLMASVAWAEEEENRFTIGNLFTRAKVLVLAAQEQSFGPDRLGREWDFSAPDQGNFTFFTGLSNLKATDEKALSFVLDADKAVLGWGNYDGKQPFRERVTLWQSFNIKLEVRQSQEAATQWRLRLWRQGKRCNLPKEEKRQQNYQTELAGTDWKEMVFPNLGYMPGPDGFDLVIEGAKGTQIEIRKLAITRRVCDGYFRKEFVIPQGQIWRAVVEVGDKCILYVNGREIADERSVGPRPKHGYASDPTDITRYLKPGQNCIGLFGTSLGMSYPPFVFLQGKAIMASSEMVLLDSDESWKWSPKAAQGWSAAGFDDSAWRGVFPYPEYKKHPEDAKALVGWNLNYRPTTDRPGYDGYLVMENPYEDKLFYSDGKAVIFNVRIPEGLRKQQPVVEWRITRYAQGQEKEIGKGAENKCAPGKGSLLFTIKPGALPRGVYILYTKLVANNEVIEDRIPEPFVVVGKLPMKEVDGDFYEQGMDPVLEDVIDFTNPGDPHHPWLETDGTGEPLPPLNRVPWAELSESQKKQLTEEKWVEQQKKHAAIPVPEPLIVERNGLKYRETRPNMGAHFSYLVEFKHPGDFYLLVLEYPNDDARWIGVSCTESGGGAQGTSKCCPVVWTGDKYPLTNTMQEMKWIYRPDPGKHAIDVMSLRQYSTAAAARLRIYHIAQGLPALRAPEQHTRWFGILTETSDWRQSFEETFRCLPFEPLTRDRSEDWAKKAQFEPVAEMCKYLEGWLDTCEKYAMYLRFTGQNMHVMGCWQYSDGQAYADAGDPRIDLEFRDLAVRVFNENDIDFLASVEFTFSKSLLDMLEKTEGGTADIWDTPFLVDKEGNELDMVLAAYYATGWNFNHPRVWEKMLRAADDLAEKFKSLPNFRGINWSCYLSGEYMPTYTCRSLTIRDPDPLGAGYGDVTIREFEKDTGIKLPVKWDDPLRFQKRYSLLTSKRLKEKWIQWRCQRVTDFFASLVKQIRKKRPDLICIASPMFYEHHARQWKRSGIPLQEFLNLRGWDSKMFRKDPNLWLTHWLHASPHQQPVGNEDYPYGFDINVGPEFQEFFATDVNPSAMIQHSWQEPEGWTWRLPFREGWPRPGNILAQAYPGADNVREAFTQALIRGDPRLVMYNLIHVNITVSHEQELREFARVLQALPSEKFAPVDNTGFETNFAIRELRKKNRYHFYVANPGYWPIEGSVTLAGADQVLDAVTGKTVARKKGAGAGLEVPVKLKGFGVAAFVVDSRNAKITGWQTKRLSAKDLAHMQKLIDRTRELLAVPEARVVLTRDDQAYMEQTIQTAQEDIKAGNYARPWSILTDSRYWILLHEFLEKGAQYGTERERDESVTRERRTLRVARTNHQPVIDGKLNDATWKAVQPVIGFVMQDGSPAIVRTAVYAAHDQDNLYLAFACKDRHPEKIKKDAAQREDEGTVWRDDHLAMFLQPDLEKSTYYQMALSAGGVKFDQRVVGGDRDYEFAPDWQVATSVAKDAWIVEVKMPAAALAGKIEPGKVWGFNCHRGFRFNEVRASSWSYTPPDQGTAGSWHNLKSFGRLQFE